MADISKLEQQAEKKIKDSDIIKALECCAVTHDCRKCDLWQIHSAQCVSNLLSNALDLINRQQAEIERLEELLDSSVSSERNTVDNIPYERAKAIKEFVEKINREITEAIISNDDAITEREKKHSVNRYEDNFCAMCEGKIIALSGIKSFINDLVKERLGE